MKVGSWHARGLVVAPARVCLLRPSEDYAIEGAAMLEKLSAMQMEGIVSKNVEAPYRSGRNESWLKIKCVQRAKFPIVGFVKDPAGLAALHLAKREWKDFVYVGKSRHGLQSKIINGNPQEA